MLGWQPKKRAKGDPAAQQLTGEVLRILLARRRLKLAKAPAPRWVRDIEHRNLLANPLDFCLQKE